jgi:hypothetical protein
MIISLPYSGKIKLLTGAIPDFKKIQNDVINIIDSSSDVQNNKTNLKCKMTDWRLHKFDSNFLKMANHVKKHVEDYQRKNHKSTHEITVTEFWGAHYGKDGEALEHSHYPALWSGVIYIKFTGTCKPTVFPECNYEHLPKEGNFIIFPGWLRHYVKTGSNSRYICAFNMRALNII